MIDERGQNLGVLPTHEALKLALERHVDLIEIVPNAKPPVAKLIEIGKYRYETEKALKKQRAKERKDITKTVQISFGAKIHDLEVWARKAEEFLNEGHKVQIVMRLRGRQKAHRNLAYEKLQNFFKIIPIPVKVMQEQRTPQGFQALIAKE